MVNNEPQSPRAVKEVADGSKDSFNTGISAVSPLDCAHHSLSLSSPDSLVFHSFFSFLFQSFSLLFLILFPVVLLPCAIAQSASCRPMTTRTPIVPTL